MHYACKNGNLKVAKYLAKNGTEVISQDEDRESSLWFAASNGHLSTVKFLLTHIMGIPYSRRDGSSPLHAAAMNGHLNIVKYLIQQGGPVDPNNNFETPLHGAVIGGNLKVVKYLVEQGADINHAESDEGRTTLHWGCEYGTLAMVKYLVQKGADIDNFSLKAGVPILVAAQEGSLDIVKFLVKKGAKYSYQCGYDTPLSIARMWNMDDVAEYLESLGTDPNSSGNTNFGDNVSEYINYQKTEHTKSKTAAQLAIENGHPEFLPILKVTESLFRF